LKKGQNSQLPIEDMKFIGHGKIKAKLYDFGDYPGAVEDEESYVSGEVYEAKNIDILLPSLDRYEEFDIDNPVESLFVRKIVEVTLENGNKTPSMVYFYNKGIHKGRLISGN
jgi:gamma-glutamylcyclotransferase (GGCT)/AIG2-like uncharacterized protein YtfP